MPVPAVVGLAAIFSAIGGFFTAAFTWFAEQGARRLILIGIYVTAATALVFTLYSVLESLAVGLIGSVPSEIVQFSGMVFPSNTGACISAIFASDLAFYTYRWNLHILQKKFQ